MRTASCAVLAALASLGAATQAATEGAALPAPSVSIEPLPYPTPAALNARAAAQLAAERGAFAQDLREIYRWKCTVSHKIRPLLGEMAEAEVDGIVERLERGTPRDTPEDNLARFYEALALRVPPFAKALALSGEGAHIGAAAALEPLMEENPLTIGVKVRLRHDTLPPYCYSTVKFLYAECLGRAGNLTDCTIAYHVVYMKVPRSLTLAAPAMMRVARVYDGTARAHYAIGVYQALAVRMGHLLSDAENLRLANRVMALGLDHDPYRLAERRSTDLLRRLERDETGAGSLASGEALMGHMRGMLVGVDEEARPFLESTMAIVQGASEGKLRSGKVADELILGEAPAEGGDDQWGRLPPRERRQLLEALKERYPERYGEMLEEYYRRMSELESASGGTGAGR